MSDIQFTCGNCDSVVRVVFPPIDMGSSRKTASCANCNQIHVLEMALWMELRAPKYKDKKWLNKAYSVEGRSMSEIGKMCGVTAMTIRKYLILHDIERRNVGQPREN